MRIKPSYNYLRYLFTLQNAQTTISIFLAMSEWMNVSVQIENNRQNPTNRVKRQAKATNEQNETK